MEEKKLLNPNLEGKEEEAIEEQPEEIAPTDTSSEELEPVANESEQEVQPQEAPIKEEHEQDGKIVLQDDSPEVPVVEEDGAFETSIKTFTQDDVDKLVGETRVKTREKTFNYIYNRYGVKDEEELDSLVANAQRYDTQKEMYESDRSAWEQEKKDTDGKLTEMSEQIALMQSGIDPERYEDAKFILKGKGLDVTLENIEGQLETHPEWKKSVSNGNDKIGGIDESKEPQEQEAPKVTTRIKTLGNEPRPAPQKSEEEEAEKLFKMKFHS